MTDNFSEGSLNRDVDQKSDNLMADGCGVALSYSNPRGQTSHPVF
jgi:hypothetical protein